MKPTKQNVFVGLSGGVDSSTTAHLLVEQGYEVVGVYMKNWTADIGDYRCPWRDDYLAAKRLAAFLKIRFVVFDFQKQYRQLVVDAMLTAYQAGLTPNPDIQCNQSIKFDLFLRTCLEQGADFIATGHYARVQQGKLYSAADTVKDQTYFLYRMPVAALDKVLFPLGDLTKPTVRHIAREHQLPNAERAESMGICFVGAVGMRQFLQTHLSVQPGAIIDDQQQVVGEHQGAALYTLGQRHGLQVGGGLPYYVTGKDMVKNEVYVSRNLNAASLWGQELHLQQTHWLVQPEIQQTYQVRLRHQGDYLAARLTNCSATTATLQLTQPTRLTATGQSAVLYNQSGLVLGGGLITS